MDWSHSIPVILSRSLTLSGSLFPCLKFGKNNSSIYFIMQLWGLTETPHVKHSAHTNTQWKWVIIVIIIIEGTSQIGFPVSLTSEPVLLSQVTKALGWPLLSHSSLYCTSQLRAEAWGIDVCWGTLVASDQTQNLFLSTFLSYVLRAASLNLLTVAMV